MATNRKRKFRGIASPVLIREPLLVRLCATFVENLTLILRTGLIMGAVLLVHDLRILLEEVNQPVAEAVPAPAVPAESEAIGTIEAQETVLSEGVMHALNCTYEDYRNTHYDECVKDPSHIYLNPHADPDDTGHVIYDAPVLYARLDDYARAVARIERGLEVVTDEVTISLR
jgi:hypothetical protein